MARASPSVPRETRTYSLNNKANKEQQKEDIREQNGILFYPGNEFSLFFFCLLSPLCRLFFITPDTLLLKEICFAGFDAS